MAGHSHWAGIKHKKALIDNKRGKLWGKLSKAVIVAAKMGGGDPDQNPRLRLAISDAKSGRMPKDTIERAIKKGTGELEGGNFEEIVYEGYGAGGVAVYCDILTDNRNRTAPEIRKIFELGDGNLGATGCVAWMFERKGLFLISKENSDEDTLMEIALEAGADDVELNDDTYEITCSINAFEQVKQALKEKEIETKVTEISQVPSNYVNLDLPTARKILDLMETLEDHDDVQSVYANFDISPEILKQIESENQ